MRKQRASAQRQQAFVAATHPARLAAGQDDSGVNCGFSVFYQQILCNLQTRPIVVISPNRRTLPAGNLIAESC
jgi:hypothetical protein